MRERITSALRASPLLVVGLVFLVPVVFMAPQKVGLLLWGLCKLGAYGYGGYWLDRWLFPYARPHSLTGTDALAAQARRALIVSAAVIAGAILP